MFSFNLSNQSLVAYEYDVPKAKDLLVEAGWKDIDGDVIADKEGGLLEQSSYSWPQWPSQPPMTEAIASQLKDIGIKVNVDVVDHNVINTRKSSRRVGYGP